MKSKFDKMSIDKWSKLYTNDKTFIKDTQLFLKNCDDLGVQQHKIDTMINIWEKINKETSFS